MIPGSDTRPPFVSFAGAAIALGLAVILSWPMLAVTAPMGYFDSFSYYQTGQAAIEMIRGVLFPPEAGGGGGGGGGGPAPTDGIRNLRSFSYAVFLFVTAQTPLKMVLSCWIQTAMTFLVLFAFIDPGDRFRMAWVAAGGAGILAVTTLPWFASYAMPDIFSAAILLYGAVLMRRLDLLGVWQVLVLIAIAALAVISHYGHQPLAVAVFGLALLWRLVQRRLSLLSVVAAVVPIAAAMSINLVASAVVLDSPSITPKRMPILLARSIEDGPARWYLNDNCATKKYAICEIFDEIPADLGEILWRPTGLKSATSEQMDRIRAEEREILREAFLTYPGQQTWSLMQNFFIQLKEVGTGEILPLMLSPGDPGWAEMKIETSDADRFPVLEIYDSVVIYGTLAGVAGLAVLWLQGRFDREERELLLICLAGICINAAIFGGLSEPADRYQSRLIWLLPVLCLFIASRRRTGAS